MSDDDLPQGTVDDAPLSFDEGVDSIDNLLGSATVNPDEEDESNEAEADDAQEEAEDDSVDDGADEDEADAEAEDDSEEADDEDEDGPDEPDEPFADEEKLVKMGDGRTISVKELREYADKRVADFQRDYTRSKQEISERSKQVEEAAQTLSQHRDLILQWYEQRKPQPPDISMVDPNSPNYDGIGYSYLKAQYDADIAEWNHFQQMAQHESQRQQQEMQAQQQELLAQERTKLLETMPDLKNPEKFTEFRGDALKFGTETYGFSPEEVNAVGDSRYLRVLRDAIAYRKLMSKAPKAKEAVKGKPKVLKGGKRSNPQSKTSQGAKARADRLARTGDLDAGIAALMDFDL